MTKLESNGLENNDYQEISFSGSNGSVGSHHSTWKVECYSDFDNQSFRTVDIDHDGTALNLLESYFSENSSGSCVTCAVLELRKTAQLCRILEDHEIVHHVHSRWKKEPGGEFNRFVIQRDFSKYELFVNPLQFLPVDMLNQSSEKTSQLSGLPPGTQNSVLRSWLLTNKWLPEFEGWLNVYDKKTWRRSFFVLRQSGLYISVKESSKDPQYLSLICGLGTVYFYHVINGKKLLVAPTDSAFAVTGHLDGHAFSRYLCAETDEARRNWIVILRLLKNSQQLKANYAAAVKADRVLDKAFNVKELHLEEDLRSRVAMDFSGDCGRILADEQEAIEAFVAEARCTRKRPKPSRSGESSPSSSIDPLLYCSQPWFHGTTSREEAGRLLALHGSVDGVYLVRRSRSDPHNALSLSFTFSGKVHNQRISIIKVAEQMCFTIDGGKTKFADLVQLIDFYHLNNGCLPTKLTHPVPSS